MRKHKNNNKALVLLLALVALISIGYAALSSNLKIIGTGTLNKPVWDVHYENIKVTDGSVEANEPVISDDTRVDYSVRLDKPGDFYEFTVDVVNAGTIDAVIDKVTKTDLNEEQKKYLSYNIKYENNKEILVGDELLKNTSQKIKVRLEFKKDIEASDLPTKEEFINMSLKTEYIQLGTKNTSNDWNDDGVLKILSVGNSFSVDTLEYVYQVANNLGIEKIELANLYYSGCTLEGHLNYATNDSAVYTYYTNNTGTWNSVENYKMSDAVASNNWDYIMFNELYTRDAFPSYYSSLNPLIEIIKDNLSEGANPKYIWDMTWPTRDIADQETQFMAVANATKTAIGSNQNISNVLPIGTAIQNARTVLGNTLNRDAIHLSFSDGRYIAAVAFVKSLLGLDVNNLTYVVPNGRDGIKDVAIKAANKASEKPYQITNLNNESNDDNEEETPINDMYGECYTPKDGYKCLKLEYTQGLWNATNGNTTAPSSHTKFISTQIFEKKYIPVGSIIKQSNTFGYYIAEGWVALSTKVEVREKGTAYNASKQGETEVTEAWWKDYNYRAFTLSASTLLVDTPEETLAEYLQIYVPISEIEKIK